MGWGGNAFGPVADKGKGECAVLATAVGEGQLKLR